MGLRRAKVNLLPYASGYVCPWVWENDLIGRRLLSGEIWDRPILDQMFSYLKPGSAFVDVGAHVGFYSLAALHLGAACVYAYEPYLYELLKINCAGLPITAVGVALADRAGMAHWRSTDHAKFNGSYPHPNDVTGLGGLGGLSLKLDDGATLFQSRDSVRVYRLDAEYELYMRSSAIPISVLKVDAQGWDLKVLRGAADLIKDHRPVVLFEYEADLSEEPISEYMEFFEKRGYSVERIEHMPNDYVAVPR